MSKPRIDHAFSWVYALCCMVFIGGLYLDGWSHQHIFDQIDSFFNPWHGVLYGGYTLSALALVAWAFARKAKNESWVEAIPAGHKLSLIGVAIFSVGGLGDMLWHILFGFEQGIEGLISPSHLVLALGMALMFSGGMRHWFLTHDKKDHHSLFASLPLLLSMLAIFAQWSFLVQYGRFTDLVASGIAPTDPEVIHYVQSVSVLGVLLFSAMLSGLFMFTHRRTHLPFGSVTIVLVLQVFMLGLMRYGVELTGAALIAGLVGDVMLSSSIRQKASLLYFTFALPAVFYTAVFVTLHAQAGIWWSLHMWSGVPVLAGISGYMAGLLASQPRS